MCPGEASTKTDWSAQTVRQRLLTRPRERREIQKLRDFENNALLPKPRLRNHSRKVDPRARSLTR
jgi:hypothetical protein